MKAPVVFFLALVGNVLGQDGSSLEELTLNNGLDRGEWGIVDLCSEGSWASSFEVKYSIKGLIDNRGLSAVKLYCQDAAGTLKGSVISREGSYGSWEGIRACTGGSFLAGMSANVMPYQGTLGDDEGLVNLEMKCSDGTILNGRFSMNEKIEEENKKDMEFTRTRKVVDGRVMEAVKVKVTQNDSASDYSNWSMCASSNRICGLKTQVETTLTDDAALCNLIMYCCSSE